MGRRRRIKSNVGQLGPNLLPRFLPDILVFYVEGIHMSTWTRFSLAMQVPRSWRWTWHRYRNEGFQEPGLPRHPYAQLRICLHLKTQLLSEVLIILMKPKSCWKNKCCYFSRKERQTRNYCPLYREQRPPPGARYRKQ